MLVRDAEKRRKRSSVNGEMPRWQAKYGFPPPLFENPGVDRNRQHGRRQRAERCRSVHDEGFSPAQPSLVCVRASPCLRKRHFVGAREWTLPNGPFTGDGWGWLRLPRLRQRRLDGHLFGEYWPGG